jgi:hypothetical protein
MRPAYPIVGDKGSLFLRPCVKNISIARPLLIGRRPEGEGRHLSPPSARCAVILTGAGRLQVCQNVMLCQASGLRMGTERRDQDGPLRRRSELVEARDKPCALTKTRRWVAVSSGVRVCSDIEDWRRPLFHKSGDRRAMAWWLGASPKNVRAAARNPRPVLPR